MKAFTFTRSLIVGLVIGLALAVGFAILSSRSSDQSTREMIGDQAVQIAPAVVDNQAVWFEMVRGLQIVLGNGKASQSPENRNVMVICHGRKGDHFDVRYHPESPELWIMRVDGSKQWVDAAIKDPASGVLMPVDVFLLVDENKDPIEWAPTWMELAPQSSALSAGTA